MEQRIQTVTDAHIESLIAAEYWVTGEDAFREAPMHPSVQTLTLYILVLKNGFTVVGKSNCVDPTKYNAELGRKVARENAKEQIWELEGYALRSQSS